MRSKKERQCPKALEKNSREKAEGSETNKNVLYHLATLAMANEI